MSSTVKIRRASLKDSSAIKRLIKEYPETLLQKHLPKTSEFFVAVEGKKIVGCCALVIYSKRLGEIRSLAVSKDFQQRGIATALIDACITRAKKKNIYELLSVTGVPALFDKHGFGTFKNEKFALLKILKD